MYIAAQSSSILHFIPVICLVTVCLVAGHCFLFSKFQYQTKRLSRIFSVSNVSFIVIVFLCIAFMLDVLWIILDVNKFPKIKTWMLACNHSCDTGHFVPIVHR